MEQTPWIIIGAGRVGKTLGILANHLNIPVLATWNRTETSAEETSAAVDARHYLSGPSPVEPETLSSKTIWWFTVPDDQIRTAAAAWADAVDPSSLAFHTSGARQSTILEKSGLTSPVGALHPMLSVSRPIENLEKLRKVRWSVEGDSEAIEYARALLAELETQPYELRTANKSLYHASAVTASNFMVVLFDLAVEIGMKSGLSRKQSRDLLIPLVESTLQNLKENSTKESLTGPAERGDDEVIQNHLERLSELETDVDISNLYKRLTDRAKNISD